MPLHSVLLLALIAVSPLVHAGSNLVSIEPEDPSNPDHLLAAEHLDYVYHRVFLDALTSGAWDDDLDGTADRTREDLADRLDWLGVNYYNLVRARPLGVVLLPEVPVFDFFPEVQEEPYPEGIADVVALASEYDRPIWITENGTQFPELRVSSLNTVLSTLQGSIEGGADVRGFLYWSYIDNYEWNHGMLWQFGLHAFDPVTKERTPRPLMDHYAEVIKANGP